MNCIDITDFDYDLPDERIAKFPAEERDAAKLLVWQGGTKGGTTDYETAADVISLGDSRTGLQPTRWSRSMKTVPAISETRFRDIASFLPSGSLLVFNNTRVVRARLVMHRPSGARIEILCLEPVEPADYERAFAARGCCEWSCMVGNLKKWVGGTTAELICSVGDIELRARRMEPEKRGAEQIVGFSWNADLTFGQLLELLGRMPIPPYLGRDSEAIDSTRYQTVYAQYEGSVAAPTAGLHFTPELIERLKRGGENGAAGVEFDEVTLHVGAGTFLPVKVENALEHPMHTEHFEVTRATVERLLGAVKDEYMAGAASESENENENGNGNGNENGSGNHSQAMQGRVIAVGTTSVRTLESLVALGWRISQTGGAEAGSPDVDRPIGQFELYDIPAEFTGTQALRTLADYMQARGLDKIDASTQIMITPAGFRFRIVNGIITNFHQSKSTLLLLVSAFVGGDSYNGRSETGDAKYADESNGNQEWQRIYNYALAHDFRFLSYGDSSLLLK